MNETIVDFKEARPITQVNQLVELFKLLSVSKGYKIDGCGSVPSDRWEMTYEGISPAMLNDLCIYIRSCPTSSITIFFRKGKTKKFIFNMQKYFPEWTTMTVSGYETSQDIWERFGIWMETYEDSHSM